MIARSEPSTDKPTRPRRLRLRPLMLGVAAGAVISATVALGLMFALAEPAIPELTEAAFDLAQKRWEQNQPRSYDVDVTVSGRQTGDFHLEVRNGKVTACTRNGIAVEQVLAWDTWSVPGQFDTIDRELELAAAPEKFFQVPAGAQVLQQAEFDPQFGYPQRYERRVLGTDFTIAWTTKFAVRD